MSSFVVVMTDAGDNLLGLFGFYRSTNTAQHAADQWRRRHPDDPRRLTVVPVAAKQDLFPVVDRATPPRPRTQPVAEDVPPQPEAPAHRHRPPHRPGPTWPQRGPARPAAGWTPPPPAAPKLK